MDEDEYFDNLNLITKIQKKKSTNLLQEQPYIDNDP